IVPKLFGDHPVPLKLHGPVTTLVGPNGSGKSQVMRQLKRELQRKVGTTLLLPAGRLQPMEKGRMILQPGVSDPMQHGDPNLTLHKDYRQKWYEVESVQGVLDQLSKRHDIRIKVA